MKKIVFIFFLFVLNHTYAQEGNTPAAILAKHIAQKMADSLSLSNQQRAKIFVINMDLYKQKTDARGKSKDRTIIESSLQRIEGKRDSLYKELLTPEQQTLYLKKKINLVSAK